MVLGAIGLTVSPFIHSSILFLEKAADLAPERREDEDITGLG
jgi:hypothetical protein